MAPNNFQIISATEAEVIIQDISDISNVRSVTNDAENVVKYLHLNMGLGKRRLLYYDTMGQLDELVHDGEGNFLDFKLLS